MINLSEVVCEVFKKEHLPLIKPFLGELEIDENNLIEFMRHSHNVAFIARHNGEILGFIYGYSQISLSNKPMFMIYSVDILEKYQNQGIGSKFFKYVVDYTKENGFSEAYVITDKSNARACRVYEKAGGKADYEDEVVYVIEHR